MPAKTSFLHAGQSFEGSQNVTHSQSKHEAWSVKVRIQGCDLERGYLCGSMEALNVPSAESSVVTFWEGEIVDNRNYGFVTGRWDATKPTDLEHWSKFPCFASYKARVEKDGGKDLDLASSDFVFMRWKEQFFVNVGPDCGLTIAGFYYVCYRRSDGSIDGFYYDPNSTPFQKLELKPDMECRSGYAFGEYTLN